MADEPDLALDTLERHVEATRPFSTDFAAGIEARTRALILCRRPTTSTARRSSG